MDRNSSSAKLPKKTDHDSLLVELLFLRAVEGKGVDETRLMDKIMLLLQLNNSSLVMFSDLGRTLPEYIAFQARQGHIVWEGSNLRLTPDG